MIDDQDNIWVAGTIQGSAAEMNSAGPSVTHASAGSRDIFVGAFDAAGAFQWSGTAGGTTFDGNPQLAQNGTEYCS